MQKIQRINVSIDVNSARKLEQMHTGTLANNCKQILEAASNAEVRNFYGLLSAIANFSDVIDPQKTKRPD